MNVGMLACYDQAKEVTARLLGDPMTDGPSLPTKMGSAAIAVSDKPSVICYDKLRKNGRQLSPQYCVYRVSQRLCSHFRLT